MMKTVFLAAALATAIASFGSHVANAADGKGAAAATAVGGAQPSTVSKANCKMDNCGEGC